MEGTMGEIRMFAGNYAPRGWAYCQAQLESIAQNSALFAILGTTYGGDGQVTFGLPDLRGRTPIGTGNGGGLSQRSLGDIGGVPSTTLIATQLPQHNHVATFTGTGGGGGGGTPVTATLNVVNAQGGLATGGTGLLAGSHGLGSSTGIFAPAGTATIAMDAAAITVSGSGGGGITGGTVAIAVSGGSQPVSITQPYLGMNFIVCLEGIFPSRN